MKKGELVFNHNLEESQQTEVKGVEIQVIKLGLVELIIHLLIIVIDRHVEHPDAEDPVKIKDQDDYPR
jgi:hypothetical protein